MNKFFYILLISYITTLNSYAKNKVSIDINNTSLITSIKKNTDTQSYKNRVIELTLSDAIYLGVRGNRSIKSAYLDRISQKFELRTIEDMFTPKTQIKTSYLYDRNKNDKYKEGYISPETTLLTPYGTMFNLSWARSQKNSDNSGIYSSDGANISIIQPLLRGAGKDIATAPVKLGQLTEQLNRLTLKNTIIETLTNVTISYRDLLLSQEQVKIARQSLERSRRLVKINQAMIDAGRMAEFDIIQTEADVASQELTLQEALNHQEDVKLALLQLLGLDLNSPIIASDHLTAKYIDVNIDQALSEAAYYQPGWLIKLINVKQALINLSIATNNRLWDVSLVAGASQNRVSQKKTKTSHDWDNYIGLQLTIPIGDMNAQLEEVRAKINFQNQSLQLKESHQQLERDVNNAIRNLKTSWRQYEISLRLSKLSKQKLDIERKKLTIGRSSNFQVLSFENDRRNADNMKITALINYLNAQTYLDKILGTSLKSWGIYLND